MLVKVSTDEKKNLFYLIHERSGPRSICGQFLVGYSCKCIKLRKFTTVGGLNFSLALEKMKVALLLLVCLQCCLLFDVVRAHMPSHYHDFGLHSKHCAVFSVGTGYAPDQLKPFVASLRGSGFQEAQWVLARGDFQDTINDCILFLMLCFKFTVFSLSFVQVFSDAIDQKMLWVSKQMEIAADECLHAGMLAAQRRSMA
jgi:hypothetical protein